MLRINVTAHELLDQERIYQALAPGNLALLAGATAEQRRHELHRALVGSMLRLLLARADLLDAAGQASALAQERYLDGCPALFPDTAAAWQKQLHETRQLAAMALGLADLEGIEPPTQEEEVLGRLVERRLADLVEWSRVTALEKLGEGERGWSIAVTWLRGRVQQSLVHDPTPSLIAPPAAGYSAQHC